MDGEAQPSGIVKCHMSHSLLTNSNARRLIKGP
jgi:hypothetical protein